MTRGPEVPTVTLEGPGQRQLPFNGGLPSLGQSIPASCVSNGPSGQTAVLTASAAALQMT